MRLCRGGAGSGACCSEIGVTLRSLAIAALALATPLAAEPEGVVTTIIASADHIDLLPGQSVIFMPADGQMTMIRIVEGEMEPREGELKLEFGMMMGQASLIASSMADEHYNYRAEILKKAGDKKGKPTTVCTIIPNGGAFETWPYAIPAIRVKEFKAVDEGEIGCR